MKVCYVYFSLLCPECNFDHLLTQKYFIDELAGFEESWKGNAGHHLPGWNQNAGPPNSDNSGKLCFIFVRSYANAISFIDLVYQGCSFWR